MSIIAIILLVTTLFLTGCEFSFGPVGEPKQISGYVTYETQPLSGVSIVSNFMTLATTNQSGYYSFTTFSANLSFNAKKTGYSFNPRTYDISSPLTEYNFEAETAQLLSGNLRLKNVLFNPTSISTLIDNNYNYMSNSTNNLKISEFVLKFNQEIVFHLNETTFLEQNKSSNILNDEQLEIEIENGQTNYLFEFQIKTYFKYNNNQSESVSIEPFKILRIVSTLYTGDLNEENQIIFFTSGNSSHNGFSYNLQFVFEYVK